MYKDGQKVWSTVLSSLKLSISSSTYRTWFSGSYVLDYKPKENGGLLVIGVKNAFLKEQIEKRYQDKIESILTIEGLANVQVVFVVSQKEPEAVKFKNTPLFTGVANQYFGSMRSPESLNPRHTFDNFVVGQSNNLAYLVATQTALQLGKLYNPLVFYGPTGVGKTHLIQAVGNEILAKYEDAKVLYVTAEKFTNDYLESLSNKTQGAFRQKYRNVHVLIVDDIQFFAGKESTQDEFFHTFNDLYLSGKQIIAASDRHPKELGKLRDRLVTRFLGGMCTDLGLPDLEMRLSIIRAKCNEQQVNLQEEMINYLASECLGGVRELEGMLTSAIAHIRLSGASDVTSELKGLIANSRRNKTVDVQTVIDAVCKYYQTNMGEIKGPSRKASLVAARQVLMYLLRKELGLSLEVIGGLIGGRDHSTIIYGVDKISSLSRSNRNMQDELLRIQELFNTQPTTSARFS